MTAQSGKRVAVVTGANRGIGLETVRQLARSGIRTVLTCRDPEKGKAAVKTLTDEGLEILFHPLDVTSEASVKSLGEFIRHDLGRVDILVNNAGIFPDSPEASVFDARLETLRDTLETNVYGPLLLAQQLVPLMKKQGYGRIVNISSGMGQLSEMGGHSPAYRISKTALNALTRIVAAETVNQNILVNSLCPGWVRTAMGGPNAERSPAEAAATIVWAATLPDDGPTGGFFRDRKPIDW